MRTIMIFPEFENMEIIDGIRKKYDPLADLVRRHITLVFPFDSKMTNGELAAILEERLAAVKPFDVKLQGISRRKDIYGNYLSLNVFEGSEELCSIHQMLYEDVFAEFDLDLKYIPHMTVGKLPTEQLLDIAYDEVRSLNDTFNARVDKISVEMIGEKEESNIVIEKQLS